MHPEIPSNNDRDSSAVCSLEKGNEGKNNIYNLNNDIDDYDMFNFQLEEDLVCENDGIINSNNLVNDLITSSPIMNKKKMF